MHHKALLKNDGHFNCIIPMEGPLNSHQPCFIHSASKALLVTLGVAELYYEEEDFTVSHAATQCQPLALNF